MSSSRRRLAEALQRTPRVRFAHLPTPIEPLERLGAHLGGPKLWIKRDDCTGLATGGNKTRKLEFLVADALENGADTLITSGAVQSNHTRQTAAAAGRFRLGCKILLERRVAISEPEYAGSGNVFLDQLFGAEVLYYPVGTDMNAALETVAAETRDAGATPYVIPGGGSSPVGARGYTNAALEILDQAETMALRIDHVVHATGSAGTQAGLVTGMHAAESGVPILGIGVRTDQTEQEAAVWDLARRTCDSLGVDKELPRDAVRANCDYYGDGYGLPTEGMVEAVTLTARLEGILLDPVYSGKGMAGLIDLVRKGRFASTDNVLFIHTGGVPALFGYRWAFPG